MNHIGRFASFIAFVFIVSTAVIGCATTTAPMLSYGQQYKQRHVSEAEHNREHQIAQEQYADAMRREEYATALLIADYYFGAENGLTITAALKKHEWFASPKCEATFERTMRLHNGYDYCRRMSRAIALQYGLDRNPLQVVTCEQGDNKAGAQCTYSRRVSGSQWFYLEGEWAQAKVQINWFPINFTALPPPITVTMADGRAVVVTPVVNMSQTKGLGPVNCPDKGCDGIIVAKNEKEVRGDEKVTFVP